MHFSKLYLCYVITLFLTLQKLVHCEPKFPCFFIFGDSLVDNGNNIPRNTTAKVNYLPYGIDYPTGPTGRFTNGRNLADFLAELMGFDKPIPPYANASSNDLPVGVNYASGGAGILYETGRETFGDVLDFDGQLSNHKTVINHLSKRLGGRTVAKRHLNKCIYSVIMGNNDYLASYLAKYHSSNAPYTPKQYAQILIAKYSTQLLKLYYYGARKVAVFAVGKLGCTPQEVAKYGATEGSVCVETSNEVAQVFNEQLAVLLKGFNFVLPGANFVYTEAVSDSFGNITNLSDPCCELAYGHCLPGAGHCENRDEYLFWDEVHPTEAAYYYNAKAAYASMSPLYAEDDVASI